jgi:hypothetical protein
MIDTSQSRERTREAPARSRDNERTPERRQDPPPAERPATNPQGLGDAIGGTAGKTRDKADSTPATKVEEATVTAGRAGEKNITVQWLDIWVDGNKPCYFHVTTQSGHGLEVTVEQLAYKKTYTGTGALTTQPVPVVPIGTTFTIVSRDTTTGEVVEQKGIWYDMSGRGGGGTSLWALIKKLIWKG